MLELPFRVWLRHGAAPVAVAMPVGIDVRRRSDVPGMNTADRFLRPRRIAVLVADLEKHRVAGDLGENVVIAFDGEAECLLSIDGAAGLRGRDDVLGVKRYRRGDEDGVEIGAG